MSRVLGTVRSVSPRIDHLVIAADSLEQGEAWCAGVFGVEPSGGGRHALMGTHNRLMSISSEHFPDCYLELIAIDPAAAPPGRPRWFGLDDPVLREALRERPRLVHAVARTRAIESDRRGLVGVGLDPGEPLALERETPYGMLRWLVTVREDGRTESSGALPSLIEWHGTHPAEHLPPSGVELRDVVLRGLPEVAHEVLRLPAVVVEGRDEAHPEPVSATFDTSHGRVVVNGWVPPVGS